MLDTLTNWIAHHSQWLLVATLLSFLLLVVSVLLAPYALARMPSDYFVLSPKPAKRTAASMIILTLRNGVGIALIIASLPMFLTPGPGIVFLILGLVLCEFPGKHELLQWLVKQRNVLKILNWLRARANTPPFTAPPA